MVNNDPGAAVHYKLTITPSFTDISLNPDEQTLITSIWDKCASRAAYCYDIMPVRSAAWLVTTSNHINHITAYISSDTYATAPAGAVETPSLRQT